MALMREKENTSIWFTEQKWCLNVVMMERFLFSLFLLLLSKINDSEVEKVCAVLDRPMLRADGLFVFLAFLIKKQQLKKQCCADSICSTRNTAGLPRVSVTLVQPNHIKVKSRNYWFHIITSIGTLKPMEHSDWLCSLQYPTYPSSYIAVMWILTVSQFSLVGGKTWLHPFQLRNHLSSVSCGSESRALWCGKINLMTSWGYLSLGMSTKHLQQTGEGVECKDVYQRAAVWWKTPSSCIMLNVFWSLSLAFWD